MGLRNVITLIIKKCLCL